MGLRQDYHDRSDGCIFTEQEAEYLCRQRLGRVATCSARGEPHVVPVVYEFDGRYIYFGGWNLPRSLKYRNLLGNSRVAFVVDDLASQTPWAPRGVEVRGLAEVLTEDCVPYVRISPGSKRSWGLGRE